MASHFSCVGVPAGSAEELNRTLPPLLDQATWADRPRGGRMAEWTDPSGARVTFYTDRRGSIECCTPSYTSESRLRVRTTGIVKDKECEFCDLLHVEVLDDRGE
ncbi:MAG: hypothetical protein JO332_13145, partial [Planctomycetaceae bacterium]|nr:hypothetical protein [Planctomycetaceae bacterium]